MNILNGNEAFTALMAGKNIMCRAIGELIEFNDLDQFPATIFATPGYEFCIKIDSIELAGISFLKPFTPDEVEADQEIFICENYSRITKCQYIPERIEMTDAIKSGFVQRDRENATKQIQAIQKALGIETQIYYQEIDFKALIAAKPAEAKKRASKKTKEAFQIEDTPVTETDPDIIVENFANQIKACTTTDAALHLRYAFSANGHLADNQVHHLMKLVEDKCIELDPEQYATKPEAIIESTTNAQHPSFPIESELQIRLDALKTCINKDEIDVVLRDMDQINFSQEQILEITMLKEKLIEGFQKIAIDQANENQYQKLLAELLERAQEASSPAEANALYKYTTQWTEEQRKPLMQAITKRLQELNQQKEVDTEQPPSLMVRILNTRNEHELNELLPEIRSRHPDIQAKLMDLVKKRRFELVNQGSQVAL